MQISKLVTILNPLGINLLANSQWAGGGAAPTSYTQPVATGTSAPNGTAANGDVIYSQTATAQRPFLGTSATFTLAANTTYTVSMDIDAVSGSLTPSDVLLISSLPVGNTVTFPPCSANVNGGSASAMTTGRLKMTVLIGATAGSSAVYFGIGCNGNATGSLSMSSPQFEVGLGGRYRRTT